MHGWVLRDAAVPSNGCCFLAKKILEYCDSSVFIITTIMTMTIKNNKRYLFHVPVLVLFVSVSFYKSNSDVMFDGCLENLSESKNLNEEKDHFCAHS